MCPSRSAAYRRLRASAVAVAAALVLPLAGIASTTPAHAAAPSVEILPGDPGTLSFTPSRPSVKPGGKTTVEVTFRADQDLQRVVITLRPQAGLTLRPFGSGLLCSASQSTYECKTLPTGQSVKISLEIIADASAAPGSDLGVTIDPYTDQGPALPLNVPVHIQGAPSPTSRFVPVQPTRLMDSRTGLGVPKAKIGPAGTVTLQVAGRGGVPAVGVTAVILNVTATGPTAGTFVSVYPDGTTRTGASNLNVTAGQTRPNLVVVPVVNGRVDFYNHAGSVDLLADVSGYYTG
ncbi:hypothetical protein [Streptomyces sp. NPDC048659]|uniref:hypothetical protein n=1 Tax=Streptomyces sp. NPDC048659 TaxID=3155489 RepID=UPI00343C2206